MASLKEIYYGLLKLPYIVLIAKRTLIKLRISKCELIGDLRKINISVLN